MLTTSGNAPICNSGDVKAFRTFIKSSSYRKQSACPLIRTPLVSRCEVIVIGVKFNLDRDKSLSRVYGYTAKDSSDHERVILFLILLHLCFEAALML